MIFKLLRLGITKYLLISSFAGIIDFLIAYFFYKIIGMGYLMACNIGIFTGFIFQYYICRLYIFEQKGFLHFFFIYVLTFLFGFILADITIWVSYHVLYFGFLPSKALSMAVPFFITYLIRKGLLGLKIEKGKRT